MPRTPKNTEDRLTLMIAGWEKEAPAAKFSGMTLAQFKEAVKASYEHRETLTTCENGADSARVNRNNADGVSNDFADKVVSSVKGDPNFGEDSPLYRAFGYVLKSERASGLTRKSAETTPSNITKAA